MIEFIEVMFRALTGMRLSVYSLFVLGLLFGMGWLYGFLTTRFGIIRSLLALIFGLYLWSFVQGTAGFVSLMILAGVASHHLPKLYALISWGLDLGDLFFAWRYRQTFDDLRRKEQEAEDQAKQARREARQQGSDQNTSRQQQWREQAQARRDGHTHSQDNDFDRNQGGTSAGTAGANTDSGKGARPKHSRPLSTREQNLKLLGLDPKGYYSASDLKKAYRRTAKKAHPDMGGDEMHFIAVNKAYLWLKRHFK